jgi:hypothetical protein
MVYFTSAINSLIGLLRVTFSLLPLYFNCNPIRVSRILNSESLLRGAAENCWFRLQGEGR